MANGMLLQFAGSFGSFFLGMFGLLFFLCVCVACRNDDERFLQTKEPLTEVCGLRMQTTQHMHKFCPQQS